MPVAANSGVFIYAKDRPRLAHFYESVLGFVLLEESDDSAILQSGSLHLIIHTIPQHIAASIVITAPPEPREDSALKFFFTVPSIVACRSAASPLGGEVFADEWESSGFKMCNAFDPEGNIFQLRESLAQKSLP
jgi:predicted enzyme related to lactoylglutathione lyase